MESARSYVVALAAALSFATPVRAQRVAKVRPEFRVDAIAGPTSTFEGGVGLAQAFGTYTRLFAVMAAGVAHGRSTTSSAARADVGARFVLDPFWEQRWSVYGAGGLSLLYDERERWRPVITAAIGLEGARGAHVTPAFELGLGGGVRIGMSLRLVRGDVR